MANGYNHLRNLKEETLEVLKENGKTKDDIVWVGCYAFKIPIDKFWELADVEYDPGFGASEVSTDLVVVGTDWWLSRWEYDGSEGWEFNTLPDAPEYTVDVNSLVGNLWPTLSVFIETKEEKDERTVQDLPKEITMV